MRASDGRDSTCVLNSISLCYVHNPATTQIPTHWNFITRTERE